MAALFACNMTARGQGITMLDGRVMEGKLAKLPSITNKQIADPNQAPRPKNI